MESSQLIRKENLTILFIVIILYSFILMFQNYHYKDDSVIYTGHVITHGNNSRMWVWKQPTLISCSHLFQDTLQKATL